MINPRLLFVVSVLALATAGIHFGIRTDIAGDISKELLEPFDKANSAGLIGAALGVASLGFAISIFIGSPLLDLLGMGRLLALSSLCFIGGTLVVINAGSLPPMGEGPPTYGPIYLGMAIIGIGWGLVETVINPLAAALYVNDKTHKMNVLHAWWPGGIIIGGLAGLAMSALEMGWRTKLYLTLIPAAAFGVMCLTLKFPPTERAAAGISIADMFKEIGKRPLFLVFFFAMFLTASSELAPNQWVGIALSRTVGMPGIAILIYMSGLMFVMRHFAGPLAHRLSPVGLLWFSCLLASAGLYAISLANSPVTGLLAATIWGTGVCFMWPTMLGITSERFPRGGSLLIGLMGTAGNLAIFLVLPKIGAIFDEAKLKAAGGEAAFAALADGPAKDAILAEASKASFQFVAVLPAVLLLVFGGVWLYDRSRGGYKAERL